MSYTPEEYRRAINCINSPGLKAEQYKWAGSILLAVCRDYEDGITWMTTCTNCARLMNDNYALYCQLEQLKDFDRTG